MIEIKQSNQKNMHSRYIFQKLNGQLQSQQNSGTLSVSLKPSNIHGKGLIALRAFKPGDIICISEGYIINTRSCISIQLSSNHHFVPTNILGTMINGLSKVNHGCDPNSYIQFDQQNGFLVLKALKNISKDEEITFDYCSTEIELSHPFFCQCGKDNCRRLIRGSRFETNRGRNG